MFLLDKSRKRIQSAGPSFVTTEGPELSRQLRSSTNTIPLMWRSTSAKGGQGRQGGNPAWDSFFLLFSQFNQRDKTATGGWYKEKTSKVEVRLTTWHRLFTFWVCVFETWVWRFHRACLHNRAGILSPETAALQTGAAASPGASPSPPDRGGRTLDFYYSSERPCFLAATADRRQTRWRSALKNEAFHLETALCNYYAYKVRLQPRTQACKADGGKHCLSAPITSTRTSRAAARQANNTAEVILF